MLFDFAPILLGITVGGYSAVFFSNMLLVSWRVGELRRLISLVRPQSQTGELSRPMRAS